MESTEIRQSFLDFFAKKKHKIFPSDTLIPSGDPTLLFTSAGMVQFKTYFLGERKATFRRAASCQKCLRTTDIDQVGKTSRHHTFFEMLGNFSFGDYFKEEAILWAWEYLIDYLKLSQENLWISIFEEDDESAKIWMNKVGFPENRLVRLGKEDNFWTMGETGPCGPCSEIILDRGKDKGCLQPQCQVGCSCGRFLEIWNLVFTQFDRQKDGSLVPLPQKNIDTGMGLERLAAILQNKETNFETDLIKPIIDEIQELTDLRYQKDAALDISFRIIADHIRAVTFLNSDGVYFSNISRGYIARRLLRRATRHGRLLGIKDAFLYRLVGVVGEIFKSVYLELRQFREELSQMILEEEKRFNETLNLGMNMLEEIIERAKSKGEKRLSGKDVFKLYDSFGFPLEMTEEVAKEEGLEIDKAGFEVSMEEHKKIAQRSWKLEEEDKIKPFAPGVPPTEFVGYEKSKISATIKAIFSSGEKCLAAQAGDEVGFILDKTPFYAEAGGQIADTGIIQSDSFLAEIEKVVKNNQEQFIHWGKVQKGKPEVGEKVGAKINGKRRQKITHSHTATHLLQAALRTLVDKNIHQAGSWVGEDQFRFDFSYFKKLTPEELASVEDWVNERIKENLPVEIIWKEREEAIKSGVIALFGEKYGQNVRLVNIPGFSAELCGGTQVKSTGEIKVFKILNEASVASGIRRIEAVTGKTGLDKLREESRLLRETAKLLRTTLQEVPQEVMRLQETIRDLEKQKKKADSRPDLARLLKEVEEIRGIKVLRKRFEGISRAGLLSLIDKLRFEFPSGIVYLVSQLPDKVELVISVSPDLVKKGYRANGIAKKVSQILGGSGGGRPDLGQGGAQDSSQIGESIHEFEQILKTIAREETS